MTLGDAIVIAGLTAIVALIIRSLIKKRGVLSCGCEGNGNCGLSGSCSACAACRCGKKKK